ncbi:sugar phosphate isomerase/epimerase family protein [Enterococcus sp. LJL98]
MTQQKALAYATDYAGESTGIEEIEARIRQISEAGFSHIHWCHEWDGDYTYSIYEMQQIKEWLEKYHLKVRGLHASEGMRWRASKTKFHYRCTTYNRRDFTAFNEYNRQAGVELVKNRIEMAAFLGTTEIVLHMQVPYKSFEEEKGYKERYFKQAYQSFDELQPYALEKGVRICLENQLGTPNAYQIDQFDRMFARYPANFLGFCFDTGHGNITGSDCLEMPKRYQDRLYMIHLSDNHGLTSEECWEDAYLLGPCDEHLNPYLGTFDWEGFAKIVAHSPYEMPPVIEVAQKEAEASAFLAESIASGLRFSKAVERYRLEK